MNLRNCLGLKHHYNEFRQRRRFHVFIRATRRNEATRRWEYLWNVLRRTAWFHSVSATCSCVNTTNKPPQKVRILHDQGTFLWFVCVMQSSVSWFPFRRLKRFKISPKFHLNAVVEQWARWLGEKCLRPKHGVTAVTVWITDDHKVPVVRPEGRFKMDALRKLAAHAVPAARGERGHRCPISHRNKRRKVHHKGRKHRLFNSLLTETTQ